jgi:ketohexokinase
MSRHGSLLFSPAFLPSRTIDTLGAGDVFNAGMIHKLLQGNSLTVALNEASNLAGKKCGQYGLDNLG